MEQKKSIGFGFRGWMLIIYQFMAYLGMVCFTNWPMNALGDLYGGTQTLSSIFTVATVTGVIIQLILSRNVGKIKNIKVVSIVLGAIFVKDYPEQCGCYRDNDRSMTPEIAQAMMQEEIENKKTTVWTFSRTLKCVDFWLITIPMGLLLLGAVGMMTQTTSLIGSYGYGPDSPQFGMIMLAVCVVACLGSYVLGLIDTRIGTRKAMMIAVVLMIVAGILGSIHSFPCLVAALLVLGVFMGASSNFTVSGSVQYWRREDFPSVFARVNPLANIIQAAGPMVIAMLLFRNGAPDPRGPFVLVGVCGVVSLILLSLFKPGRIKAQDDKYRAEAGKPLDDALAGRK